MPRSLNGKNYDSVGDCWFRNSDNYYNNFLPAGLREAQPCRYCFYSVVQTWVFSQHVASINVKFGTGDCGPLPVPNFTFIGVEMWE